MAEGDRDNGPLPGETAALGPDEELAPPPPEVNAAAEALYARVAQAPFRFGFLQLLRAVEAAHPHLPRLGRSAKAADDPIRLGQTPSLVFAPVELHALERDGDRPPRLSTFGYGLFGPNGPLPVHLTEHARDRLRNADDPTLVRFLDVFHHRMMCLFYRAWADSQPAVDADRPDEDRFATRVGSLLGIGMDAMRDRSPLPDEALLSRAGRLALQTRHAEGLRDVLEDYFEVPVRLQEFVGEWLTLPADARWRLGSRDGTGIRLGHSLTLGGSVWTRQCRFRVVLGPLGHADFRRFLPDGESLERLVSLVRFFTGDELVWDLHLLLLRHEVPPLELGRSGMLGRTAWLNQSRRPKDADDAIIDPEHCLSERLAARDGSASHMR